MGVAVPSIKTNLPTFDNDLCGCGGIPRGKIIEFFGPESAGKTTAALHIVGQEQKAGGLAAYIDVEHALDVTYAKHLGVDVDNLMISQPDSGEQALTIVEELIKSQLITLIIVDSVAALTPEAELAGDMGASHPGLLARLMSQAMRKLTAIANKTGTTIIFINQIREKIGVMYGNPETTTGGRALKFYASLRVEIKRREAITDGNKDNIVGHTLEAVAKKNKIGTPFRSTKLDLYYPNTRFNPGLDVIGDQIKYASDHGVFTMSGSWYNLDYGKGEERLANGLANLKDRLRDDTEILKFLAKKAAERLKVVVKTGKDIPEETL